MVLHAFVQDATDLVKASAPNSLAVFTPKFSGLIARFFKFNMNILEQMLSRRLRRQLRRIVQVFYLARTEMKGRKSKHKTKCKNTDSIACQAKSFGAIAVKCVCDVSFAVVLFFRRIGSFIKTWGPIVAATTGVGNQLLIPAAALHMVAQTVTSLFNEVPLL